ncbi:hypothetical protein BT96DRAFT_532208 [Gymnopus androsaceus JB14]|uniref:Uncharacterized protein n=1 Tax=Gymnopus androsaceus JB14 TaxID=1447944 RepID=A0A6A4IMK9_9AGAR|nr:hypothetical protein BT96DRAFT_532208 [Gymnopus androsaceus JB14]
MKSTQCPFIVDFPGTGSNPTVSFPIELSSPPFEGTGRLIFIQDCMGQALGSPRMLRTLLMTSISPRNECPRLTEEGKYSSTDINIIIHDLEAKYHPTHILVVSSSNNPWHMLLYPVHASILGMFCPKLRIGLERSPMDHEKINPALPPGPKEVALRVKQIQLTFPDTLGVLLTYLYTRCQHFIVRQCLPMYTIKGPCGEPTVDLSDEQYAESLGYLIAQGVHTIRSSSTS